MLPLVPLIVAGVLPDDRGASQSCVIPIRLVSMAPPKSGGPRFLARPKSRGSPTATPCHNLWMRWTLIAIPALIGCLDPCKNDSFKEFRSPSGKWKIMVFQRSCGATTDFSTQVSLLPSQSPPPKKAGNVLSIDSDHGRIAVDSNGLVDVHVTFSGDSTVTLAYPVQARVFAAVTDRDGVAVRHERP